MIRRNIPLARHTTFGLGGPARYFSRARSADELAGQLDDAARAGLRPYILGSGSNVLVNDGLLDGIVVANRIKGISFVEGPESVMLRAGAGVSWDSLVSYAVRNGFRGVECLSGIPGTVGAAPVQNIGAYGQNLADTLHGIRVVDVRSGCSREMTAAQCAFGYRSSIFQREALIITEIRLRLACGGAPTLNYQDLKGGFPDRAPTLPEVRDTVMRIRASKGALAMRGHPRLRSAGSFFKNPVVPQSRFLALKDSITESLTGKRWFWPQPGGFVKVSAGRLIESAGFMRGMRSGNAGLSPYHALVLIAHRGARSADIAGLARRIQETVLLRFGVLLEPEVTLWGWDIDPLLRPYVGTDTV